MQIKDVNNLATGRDFMSTVRFQSGKEDRFGSIFDVARQNWNARLNEQSGRVQRTPERPKLSAKQQPAETGSGLERQGRVRPADTGAIDNDRDVRNETSREPVAKDGGVEKAANDNVKNDKVDTQEEKDINDTGTVSNEKSQNEKKQSGPVQKDSDVQTVGPGQNDVAVQVMQVMAEQSKVALPNGNDGQKPQSLSEKGADQENKLPEPMNGNMRENAPQQHSPLQKTRSPQLQNAQAEPVAGEKQDEQNQNANDKAGKIPFVQEFKPTEKRNAKDENNSPVPARTAEQEQLNSALAREEKPFEVQTPLNEESPEKKADKKQFRITESRSVRHDANNERGSEVQIPDIAVRRVSSAAKGQQSQHLPTGHGISSHGLKVDGAGNVDILTAGTAKTSADSAVEMQQNVDKVVKAARAIIQRGSSSVQLRLDPPELGNLRIEIRQGADGLRLQLQATSHRAQQLLQHASNDLRSALEAHGFTTSHIEIQLRLDLRNEQTPGQSHQQDQSFAQNQHQEQGFQQAFSRQGQPQGSPWSNNGMDEQAPADREYPYDMDTSVGSRREAIIGGTWQELDFSRLNVVV